MLILKTKRKKIMTSLYHLQKVNVQIIRAVIIICIFMKRNVKSSTHSCELRFSAILSNNDESVRKT